MNDNIYYHAEERYSSLTMRDCLILFAWANSIPKDDEE
jgi:hypothetical protein